ncbi:MAG: PTS sugar transporter subunit IIA [Spirochaetaceae bacterium]|nr:MAG: PTS sugar transporter subunit IIA [Spirochaetaceae bacterium]
MLREVLTRDLVATNLSARSKNEVVDELLNMLCSTGKVHDRAVALGDLIENERRTATGMQHGIAIPHTKTAAVDELLACIAVSAQGIDFGSVDRKPSRIFIMTLSPLDQTGPHLRFLSEVGRLLKHRKVRERVLAAKTPDEVLHALLD